MYLALIRRTAAQALVAYGVTIVAQAAVGTIAQAVRQHRAMAAAPDGGGTVEMMVDGEWTPVPLGPKGMAGVRTLRRMARRLTPEEAYDAGATEGRAGYDDWYDTVEPVA